MSAAAPPRVAIGSAAYYRRLAEYESADPWARAMAEWSLELIRRFSPLGVGVLLDAGCGAGGFLERAEAGRKVGVDLAGHVFGRVVARLDAAGGEPIAQFIVVGGDRENHAHVEGLALVDIAIDHRLQVIGLDRMFRPAIRHLGNIRFHHFPDFIRNSDAVSIQIH